MSAQDNPLRARQGRTLIASGAEGATLKRGQVMSVRDALRSYFRGETPVPLRKTRRYHE